MCSLRGLFYLCMRRKLNSPNFFFFWSITVRYLLFVFIVVHMAFIVLSTAVREAEGLREYRGCYIKIIPPKNDYTIAILIVVLFLEGCALTLSLVCTYTIKKYVQIYCSHSFLCFELHPQYVHLTAFLWLLYIYLYTEYFYTVTYVIVNACAECCKSRTARPSVHINWLIVTLPDLDRHLHL